MNSAESPEENDEPGDQPTRPGIAGLDPRALMAEGLGPGAISDETDSMIEIPGYEMIRKLGAGGMGTVFLARQLSLNREVAVKILATGGDRAFASQFYDRLEREARAMATLSHPNIVSVHDFVRLEDGGAAIVMEYVQAGTLRDGMRQSKGTIGASRAVELVRQIGQGLSEAHRAGIVHRDVKPENILITHDGTAKVTDFGIALPLDPEATRLTVTGATLGTVSYMSPEQLNGGVIDGRTDIYSLGVILYEQLTGMLPQGNFDSPDTFDGSVSRQTARAVLRALRVDPGERFQDVGGFMEALGGAENESTSNRRQWLRAAAGAGVALGALGGAGFYLSRGFPGQKGGGALPVRSMLPDLDLSSEIRAGGDWSRHSDGGLISSPDITVMRLPVAKQAVERFTMEIEFTRLSGTYSVAVFFRTINGYGSMELDAWEEGLCGIQLVDGKDLRDLAGQGDAFTLALENERRYVAKLELGPEVGRISIDGDPRLEVQLAGFPLRISRPWDWDSIDRGDLALGIGSYQASTHFHRVDLSLG